MDIFDRLNEIRRQKIPQNVAYKALSERLDGLWVRLIEARRHVMIVASTGPGTAMPSKSSKKIRVAELFAGVGGFRIGLEGHSGRKLDGYETVWSNQWEPATKVQHASSVYQREFGKKGHSCEDICTIPTQKIPEHDLLVGGFPCQDYSVARTLSQAVGLEGQKGVLWWEIYRILAEKGKKAPKYLMLENVDRLIKSPVNHRGRDFAIILSSLARLGYAVEWRVINAADYGMPQRRRRTFIMGYRKGTDIYKAISRTYPLDWIRNTGLIASAFPVGELTDWSDPFLVSKDPVSVSKNFSSTNRFWNSGVMIDGYVSTYELKPVYSGKRITLEDCLDDERDVPAEYFISEKDLPKWRYLKGPKKEERHAKSGFTYLYSEGGMKFPDPMDQPSRTIITAEGGATPSRFKHVIKENSGRYRRLTPEELERLCMFPPGHTKGFEPSRRAFFMGNALVVGVIEKLGRALLEFHRNGAKHTVSARSLPTKKVYAA